MQQVKLKPKYAYSFMAALRLIPIMMEEFQTIRNAMKVRGFEREKGIRSVYFKMKAYSIPLLSGSIRRAHRIAVAMEANDFQTPGIEHTIMNLGFQKMTMGSFCILSSCCWQGFIYRFNFRSINLI